MAKLYYVAIVSIPLQESCRRYLQFTVPRVVAVSPQMRLVEDNTSNISLADVFKQVCTCKCTCMWPMTCSVAETNL